MTHTPPPSPDSTGEAITATVTVTGSKAAFLRELAAIEGRTPEAMVQEWPAGRVVIPEGPPAPSSWGLFDGVAPVTAG